MNKGFFGGAMILLKLLCCLIPEPGAQVPKRRMGKGPSLWSTLGAFGCGCPQVESIRRGYQKAGQVLDFLFALALTALAVNLLLEAYASRFA